jgi:hypothetical protein
MHSFHPRAQITMRKYDHTRRTHIHTIRCGRTRKPDAKVNKKKHESPLHQSHIDTQEPNNPGSDMGHQVHYKKFAFPTALAIEHNWAAHKDTADK